LLNSGSATSGTQGKGLDDITFVILTFNEEYRLPGCLDSLRGLNSKIFAVDSFSTDGTVELLAERGVRYLQRRFINYGDQRRWAQNENPFRTSWVFHLDADERLTDELRIWLETEFSTLSVTYDGFLFSRRTVFMGRWIRWGGHYPAYHLRLFKAALGNCEHKAYDQHFVVAGKVLKTRHVDVIDTVTTDLESFVRSHDRWASLEAAEAVSAGKSGEIRSAFGGNPIERRRWLKSNIYQRAPLFVRSFAYFIYRYIFRLGFLDGREGLVFHVLQGFWFRFLVDAKILELQNKSSSDSLSRGNNAGGS
jgi:glycosyltransferase involved in cell wall biosynthesis